MIDITGALIKARDVLDEILIELENEGEILIISACVLTTDLKQSLIELDALIDMVCGLINSDTRASLVVLKTANIIHDAVTKPDQ